MTIKQALLFIPNPTFAAFSNTYTAGVNGAQNSGTQTIPTGASQVVITVYGPGGSGGLSSVGGGGGGGGGTAIKTIALTSTDWGKTLNYSAGNSRGGRISTAGPGLAGNNSTVTSGTYTLAATIQGNSGAAGGTSTGGAGGTASGGDSNITGNSGGGFQGCICIPWGGDGGASNGFAGGLGGTSGSPGLEGGGGGGGGVDGDGGSTGAGGSGGPGSIIFSWT